MIRRFGMPLNGPVKPFGAMVEYHPNSAKDLSRLHQFGPKVLPGIFFQLCLVCGEESGKETSWVADIEELEQMDASELHARRLNAKKVLTPMAGEIFIFPVADGTVKNFWKRSGSENIHPDRGEEQDILPGESERSSFNPTTRLIEV